MTRSFRGIVWGALLVGCTAGVALAAPPSDKLLPAGTFGYAVLRDTPDAMARWDKTHLGRLASDPLLKVAIEDIQAQLEARWAKTHKKLGIDWKKLRAATVGESAVAVAPNTAGGAGEVCLMDIGKNQAIVMAEIAKLDASLAQQGSKRTSQVVNGVTVVLHEMPRAAQPAKGKTKAAPLPPDQVAYFLANDLFVLAGDLKVAVEVVGRLGGAKDTLSTDPVYLETMARCKRESGDLEPNARWFVRPIELMLVARGPHSGDSIDYLKMLQKQGFDQVRGIGGFHNLLVPKGNGEHFDVLYRAAFHVGGTLAGGSRVLGFPNGPARAPEPWVPRDIATHININWDISTAFDAVGSIVDDVMEEPGYFEDLIKQIKEEEDGPKIDIRKDLLNKLGDKVEITVISDFTTPIDIFSERSLVAIKAADPVTLEKNLARGFTGDATVKERMVGGVRIWEFHEQQAKGGRPPIKAVKVPGKVGQPPKVAGPKGPPSAICVAHGYMMFANRVGLLEKVLVPANGTRPLAGDFDYKRVDAEIVKLSGGIPVSFRAFARTADDIQPIYELFKIGKLRDCVSPVGMILRKAIGEDKIKDNPIRGDKLPNFDVVRRQLGPVGWYVKTEKEGWTLTGFMMTKPKDE